MESYAPFLAGLVALLVGLAAGKAWERYKLQEGRWIDRRRARESPHYILGLNSTVAGQLDRAISELAEAARAFTRAFEHGEDGPWAWYWAGQNAAALGDGEALDRARRELKERDAVLLRELETRVEAIAAKESSANPEEGPCHSPCVPTAS